MADLKKTPENKNESRYYLVDDKIQGSEMNFFSKLNELIGVVAVPAMSVGLAKLALEAEQASDQESVKRRIAVLSSASMVCNTAWCVYSSINAVLREDGWKKLN